MIFNPANAFPLSAGATGGTAALRTRGWGLAGRHRWHLQFNEEQGLSKHSVLAQFPDRPGTFPSRGREQSLAGTEAGIICLWHLGALYSPSRRVRAGINRKTLELWWGRGWILGWILGREDSRKVASHRVWDPGGFVSSHPWAALVHPCA